MTQRQLLPESRVRTPLSIESLSGQVVSEEDLLRVLGQLPATQLLPGLITLLQYGDSSEPPSYRTLDRRICALFPTKTAVRIADKMAREATWMFFSKWQLLLAIKLLCTFGSHGTKESQIRDEQLLNLLLMINGFYPRADSTINTFDDAVNAVQKVALLGYSVVQNEQPSNLIGRYAELFGRLAASGNQGEFRTWVDIQKVLATKLNIRLDAFKAVLFGLYAKSVSSASWPDDGRSYPELGRLVPLDFFADTRLPEEEVKHALRLVSISSEEIRDQHISEYGHHIGNPVDHRILLRKPVITLIDESVAGISGQLLIQRYTCGLYWDIHDALPDDPVAKHNRRKFQSFFGELHERYGRDILRRIEEGQVKAKRKARLINEQDYASHSGSNPDSLLLEAIGSRNTSCALFEFKVGRPRYIDSIVEGDVRAFQDDLRLKIEEGLKQEIAFCRQLQDGGRSIPDLLFKNIDKLLFVIVVTDPFPSMGMFLEPLRQKLASSSDLGNCRRYGPFVLSLAELEQLETLPKSRVSQLLIDWDAGPDRNWPFHSFYAHRSKGNPSCNSHVRKLADDDLDEVTSTLFGHSRHQQ